MRQTTQTILIPHSEPRQWPGSGLENLISDPKVANSNTFTQKLNFQDLTRRPESSLPVPFSRDHDLQLLLHDCMEITLVEGQKRFGVSLPRALGNDCVVGLSPSHMTFGKPTEEVAVGFRVERNDSDRTH